MLLLMRILEHKVGVVMALRVSTLGDGLGVVVASATHQNMQIHVKVPLQHFWDEIAVLGSAAGAFGFAAGRRGRSCTRLQALFGPKVGAKGAVTPRCTILSLPFLGRLACCPSPCSPGLSALPQPPPQPAARPSPPSGARPLPELSLTEPRNATIFLRPRPSAS